jgi:hypothetical protein
MVQDERRSGIRAFWSRIWAALNRLIGACVLGGAHYVANLGLKVVIHAQTLLSFLDAVVTVCFALIYVYLAWDMVAVFMPLRRKEPPSPGVTEKKEPPSPGAGEEKIPPSSGVTEEVE